MCVCVCVFVIDTRRQHPRATYTHSPESLLLFLTFIFKHIFFSGPFFLLLLFFIRMIHNAGPNLDRRLLGRLTEESLQESFAGIRVYVYRGHHHRGREREGDERYDPTCREIVVVVFLRYATRRLVVNCISGLPGRRLGSLLCVWALLLLVARAVALFAAANTEKANQRQAPTNGNQREATPFGSDVNRVSRILRELIAVKEVEAEREREKGERKKNRQLLLLLHYSSS